MFFFSRLPLFPSFFFLFHLLLILYPIFFFSYPSISTCSFNYILLFHHPSHHHQTHLLLFLLLLLIFYLAIVPRPIPVLSHALPSPPLVLFTNCSPHPSPLHPPPPLCVITCQGQSKGRGRARRTLLIPGYFTGMPPWWTRERKDGER